MNQISVGKATDPIAARVALDLATLQALVHQGGIALRLAILRLALWLALRSARDCLARLAIHLAEILALPIGQLLLRILNNLAASQHLFLIHVQSPLEARWLVGRRNRFLHAQARCHAEGHLSAFLLALAAVDLAPCGAKTLGRRMRIFLSEASAFRETQGGIGSQAALHLHLASLVHAGPVGRRLLEIENLPIRRHSYRSLLAYSLHRGRCAGQERGGSSHAFRGRHLNNKPKG
mmetsp:Transcript_82454/g.207989  ORF Transcript_82454/g.207989 Transcript_82454/m.207989 type:complete len:235 (-) Transcript_82454:52-756(-)